MKTNQLNSTKPVDVLVIGYGMVGHHFVENLRGLNKQCTIHVLCGKVVKYWQSIDVPSLCEDIQIEKV